MNTLIFKNSFSFKNLKFLYNLKYSNFNKTLIKPDALYSKSFFNFGDNKKTHNKDDSHAKNIKDQHINKTTLPINKAAKSQAKMNIDGNLATPTKQHVVNEVPKKLKVLRTNAASEKEEETSKVNIENLELSKNDLKEKKENLKNKARNIKKKQIDLGVMLSEEDKNREFTVDPENLDPNYEQEIKELTRLEEMNREMDEDINKTKRFKHLKKLELESFAKKQKHIAESSNYPLIVVKPKYEKLGKKKRYKIYKETIRIKIEAADHFKYSHYKLNEAIKKIRGLYLLDAEEVLSKDFSKGSRLIQFEIKKFKDENKDIFYKKDNDTKKVVNEDSSNETLNEEANKENNNPAEEEEQQEEEKIDLKNIKKFNYFNSNFILKIKEAYVGGSKGVPQYWFRAKGRVDVRMRKKSTFCIVFEKVPIDKFCQELAEGKTSEATSRKFQEALYKNRATFDSIRSLSFITNKRGKEHRKDIITSLTEEVKQKYFEQKGRILSDFVIREELVKDLGSKMVPIYKKLLLKDNIVAEDEENDNEVKKRHEYYNKNLKKNI